MSRATAPKFELATKPANWCFRHAKSSGVVATHDSRANALVAQEMRQRSNGFRRLYGDNDGAL